MSLTLLEASKTMQGTDRERGVVELFARTAPILSVLPIRGISGNALSYSQEKTLPGIAFRGVNESYTESTGILNPITESLKIAGGDVKVDNFIIKTEGGDSRAIQEAMKIKALSQDWQQSFFKGDAVADAKDLHGLQSRIVGNQLIANGSTSGGDPLSLIKLDEVIDTALGTTHLAMNKALARRLSAAARNPNVGGYITYEKDQFGQRIMKYDDIPILIIENLAGGDDVLPFTEANPGGGAAASSSIYALTLSAGMLEGIDNGGMQVRDLGEGFDDPAMKTRIEWYAGISVRHPRAAARLNGITDAAVVA